MSKSESRKRKLIIQARVSPAEKALFISRCEVAGLTAGDYIRVQCLDAKPLRAQRKVQLHAELLTQAIHQLARYGNNLNQLARKFNEKRWIKPKDRNAMREALAAIADLRLLFRKALGYKS